MVCFIVVRLSSRASEALDLSERDWIVFSSDDDSLASMLRDFAQSASGL